MKISFAKEKEAIVTTRRGFIKKILAVAAGSAFAACISGLVYANDPLQVEIPVSVICTGSENDQTAINIAGEDSLTPMPHIQQQIVTGSGTMYFGPIEYDEPGNYRYTITQAPSESEEWMHDTNPYQVLVQIVTDENGVLSGTVYANKQGFKEKSLIEFKNVYLVEEETLGTLDGDKGPSEEKGNGNSGNNGGSGSIATPGSGGGSGGGGSIAAPGSGGGGGTSIGSSGGITAPTQTGDSTPIILYVCLFAASACIIIFILWVRKRRR